MNDAKRNSFKTSVNNLVKAANNYYADNQLSIDRVMTFCFGLGGTNCTSETLNFTGKAPEKGKVIINPDGEVSLIDISNGTYYANYDSSVDDEIVITENNEVLTRDELTQAIKDLKKELADTKIELAKKSNKTDLDKVQTQLNSTTTIANTANNTANSLNSTRLNKTYPIGSIYISYSSINPGSLFGGTWVAFGTGRTVVGINTGDANFNTVGKTGGGSSQLIKLTTANLPGHTHSIPVLSGSTSSAGAHTHSYSTYLRNYHAAPGNGNPDVAGNANGSKETLTTGSSGNHTHTVTTNANTTGSTGSATAFSVNTQNPYITVYMWRRTA